jgi:hypothetical protein
MTVSQRLPLSNQRRSISAQACQPAERGFGRFAIFLGTCDEHASVGKILFQATRIMPGTIAVVHRDGPCCLITHDNMAPKIDNLKRPEQKPAAARKNGAPATASAQSCHTTKTSSPIGKGKQKLRWKALQALLATMTASDDAPGSGNQLFVCNERGRFGCAARRLGPLLSPDCADWFPFSCCSFETTHSNDWDGWFTNQSTSESSSFSPSSLPAVPEVALLPFHKLNNQEKRKKAAAAMIACN